MAAKDEDFGPVEPIDDFGAVESLLDISPWLSGAGGAVQGASFGFIDELSAMDKAAKLEALGVVAEPSRLLAPRSVLRRAMETYRAERDRNREAMGRLREANPKAFTAGEIAGAVAVPLPGATAARGASVAARLGRGALSGAAGGAAYGLGASNADLTRGEYGRAAVDTGVGAAGGALGGFVGTGIGIGVSKGAGLVRARAAKAAQEAVDAEAHAAGTLYDKDTASQLAKYRSSVQAASRDLEVMAREADQLPPGELKDALNGFLQSEPGLAVREMVARNKLAAAPGRVSEVAEELAKYESRAPARAASVEAMTAEGLRSPWAKHVKPRLKTLSYRLLPPAIGALGGAVGGPGSSVAGGVVGGIMSLTQGRPDRILANLLAKPANKKAFWGSVLSVVGETAETRSITRTLEKAAQQGPQAFSRAAKQVAEGSATGQRLIEQMAAQLQQEEQSDVADLVMEPEGR